MLEKFLPRQEFSSYEDFKENYTAIVPKNFNFGYDVVDGWAETEPNKPALAWLNDKGEFREYSFGDLKRMSDQTANMLKAHGIRKGDKVLLLLKQRVEVWVCMVALHKIGAITIPASFQLKSKDLVYRFNAAEVKMCIAVSLPEIIKEIEESLPKSPTVNEVMLVGDDVPAGYTDFRKEVATHPTHWEKPQGADLACEHDTLLIYFTSGTSGMPKMVLHDHTLPIGHIVTAKYWQQVREGERHMTASDSGWAKFAWGKIYGQWCCGAVIAAYDYDGHFVAHDFLKAIASLKLSTFCAPPTIYRFLIKEDLSQYDFSTIRQCSIAGEPLNPEVYNQWVQQTGKPLVEGFGQTESSVLIANFPWFPVKPGSTGKFSPIYNLQILDENGKQCEDGIVGNLVVVGAAEKHPVGLFREYYHSPEAMASSWRDGNYYTGDMAWRDEDGYIWFMGRNDDVIKCSGYRIGPFEVESALMEHPAVLECAVTAYPDEIRGESVKATIVLNKKAGREPSPELIKELQTLVKKITAPYKYPRVVEFVDELPKTTSGKILRAEIRKRDLAKLQGK